MQKVKLDLNALAVQSFSTTGADVEKRGTVIANSGTTTTPTLTQPTYGPEDTCQATIYLDCEVTQPPTKVCCQATE